MKIVRRRDPAESMETYKYARALGHLLKAGKTFPDFLSMGKKRYFNVTSSSFFWSSCRVYFRFMVKASLVWLPGGYPYIQISGYLSRQLGIEGI